MLALKLTYARKMSTVVDLKTYAEVYSVLNKLGENYISKLPKDLYELICKKSNQYVGNVNKLSPKTAHFLAVLHYKYWTNTEEEKQELKNIFLENEKKNKEFIEEIPKEEEKANVQLIDTKNLKWYEKIFKRIKVFINKHRWKNNGNK
jgi:hypothetical protein